MNQPRPLTSIIILIIGSGLLFGLVWGNYQFAKKNIGGANFLIQWIGIRSIITGGSSPYDDAVTAQIQQAVKLESDYTAHSPSRFTAPIFSGILTFPFAILENRILAHAFWLSAQLIALWLILLLGLRLTTWKPAWYLFLLFSLLTLLSYHVMVPWLDGGLAIWSALFLVLTLSAIHNNWNELGGVFLAFTAIKPQMVILVIVFILIWAAFQRRKYLILWFFITLILVSVIGSLLVPNWMQQYIKLLYNFPETFAGSTLAMLFKVSWPGLGIQLGWLVTVISAGVLLAEWWLARRRDFRWLLWTACLTIVVSQWIGIPTTPDNLTGLILPLILVASMLTEHWPRGGKWVATFMLLLIFAWEWVLLYLDIASPQATVLLNLLIPLPLISIIGLYWIRWWAIKPRRLLLEELRLGAI